MGLDISFNRKQAENAGMEFSLRRNASLKTIADAIGDPDTGYLEWLKSSTNYLKVPNSEHYVSDDGDPACIIVRANKWGITYKPLTDWLTANRIEWHEF
jgi:hypothetical protein